MFTRRLQGALRLGRSFLLLEDDREDVDWEVDQDEPAQAEHPHRAPLQSRLASRRNGEGEPAVQPCLSPVATATAHGAGPRKRRVTTAAPRHSCGHAGASPAARYRRAL